MQRPLRIAFRVACGVVAVIGLIGLPDDVRAWCDVLATISSDIGRWIMCVTAVVVLASVELWPRMRMTRAKALTEHIGTVHRSQSPTESLAERLAGLYDEGRRLKQVLLISSASVAGEAITGHPPKTRIQCDETTRAWDGRVAACLRKHDDSSFSTTWHSCSTLPAAHATLRRIEPSTTLSELREFVNSKIACLKTIIEELGERR